MFYNTKPAAFFRALSRATSARKHAKAIAQNAREDVSDQSIPQSKAAGISEIERLFQFYDALCAET